MIAVARLNLELALYSAYAEGKWSSHEETLPSFQRGVCRAMQTFEVVSVVGGSLWTVRQGHGPALVCCHGGPGLWDYLEPVAAMLDDLWTVHRYDQRSCGRSTGSPPYDVATAVADRRHARELAQQLFVASLHINFQVNQLFGEDADHFAQRSTLPAQLADLRIPTLVVHGGRDPRPARVARQPGSDHPFCSYVELPGVGHLPWLERPDLLRDALRHFLEALP